MIDRLKAGEPSELPGVSFIMPILNEAKYIERAVSSVLAQKYDGDKEVILALGPSTDGTDDIVGRMQETEPRLKTVHSPTGATPAGLNLAIAASSYPVVIRVDAHSELLPDYTQLGVATLLRTGADNVGGLMDAKGENAFQSAVARAYVSPVGLGGGVYHSGKESGPAESAYLGIFRREALIAAGCFDETLRRAQDWDLNLRIRERGGTVWFDPELKVTYWPRSSWSKLVRQFYATGVWRGELVRRHSARNSLRYFAPPLLVASIFAGLLSGALKLLKIGSLLPSPAARAVTFAAWAPVSYPVWLLWAITTSGRGMSARERMYLLFVLPSMHISWGLGFISGLSSGAADQVDTSR
ncbi:MAG TPA: glycosyltransferase family 2 protein [Arthrobacter sp.]|nr:glycosyltransferase family 2 protein [Arthrobacter sp.]